MTRSELKPTHIFIREGRTQRPSLEEAQEMVEGYVTMVRMPNGDQHLLNEEGQIHNLPVNPAASALMTFTVLGNMVILKGEARWD